MARFYENDRNTPPPPPRPPRPMPPSDVARRPQRPISPPMPSGPRGGSMIDEPTELINSLRNRGRLNEGLAKSGLYTNEEPPRFGGRIPSPRQSYDEPSRSFDPGTDALLRSYKSRMEMPEEPRVRDMPDMTLEEMAPYNRPADDINDAFFGPDREPFQWTDILDFLLGRSQGGR